VVSGIAHGRKHPVTALYIVPATRVGRGEDQTLEDPARQRRDAGGRSDETYVPAMIAALGG
jgi:hypothetical protein